MLARPVEFYAQVCLNRPTECNCVVKTGQHFQDESQGHRVVDNKVSHLVEVQLDETVKSLKRIDIFTQRIYIHYATFSTEMS